MAVTSLAPGHSTRGTAMTGTVNAYVGRYNIAPLCGRMRQQATKPADTELHRVHAARPLAATTPERGPGHRGEQRQAVTEVGDLYQASKGLTYPCRGPFPPSWPAKAGHPRLSFVRAAKAWMAGLRRP